MYLSHLFSAGLLTVLSITFLHWFKITRSFSMLTYAIVFIVIVSLLMLAIPLLTEQYLNQSHWIYPRSYSSLVDILSLFDIFLNVTRFGRDDEKIIILDFIVHLFADRIYFVGHNMFCFSTGPMTLKNHIRVEAILQILLRNLLLCDAESNPTIIKYEPVIMNVADITPHGG